VNDLGDCESVHEAEERDSGPREATRTWDRASAVAEAKGAAAGEAAVRKGAKKVSWKRGELGFGRGRFLRRRGFRVLRNAMAVDRGALEGVGPYVGIPGAESFLRRGLLVSSRKVTTP
jgi:hypothetical protein